MDYNDADDTAEDMPVPPCPGTALPALADQPVRRCTKGLGHKGACADDAGELLAEPLPQREPGAALNCVELSSHGDMCTLVAGHKGYHRGEGGVSWGVGAPPVANSVSDASSWIGRVFGGLGGPALSLKMGPLTPQPVRVRFVDLPHRHTAVDGPLHRHPVHIAEPGGFALVVDRFRDAGHRGSELTRWELFGAAIGAHTVLCYVGELDIVSWFAE